MDETEKTTFNGSGGDGRRKLGVPSTNDVTLRQQMGDSAMHSGQIVLKAVTAAASGKDEWSRGVEVEPRHIRNVIGNGEEDVDVSLQLFDVIVQGDLSIQADVENGPRADATRHGVPPGLSEYTPHSDVEDQDAAGNETRRRRMPTCGGQQRDLMGLKDFDRVQSLQRFVGGKTKPESCSSAVRQNGRAVSGRNEPNGGVVGAGIRKNGTQGEGGKGGKESARSGGGARRGTQRKASGVAGGTEGREKRQRTSASSTDAR